MTKTFTITSLILGLLVAFSSWTFAQAPYDSDMGENEFVEWIVVEGRGASKQGAIVDARIKALMKYLRANMDTQDYQAHENQIENYLVQNWRSYCKQKSPVVEPYENRLLRVMIGVRSQRLTQDIRQRFLRAREKAEGLIVSIVPDPNIRGGQRENQIMISVLTDKLGKHFTIKDMQAAQEAMREENRATNYSAIDNPGSYAWERFNLSHVVIYGAARSRQVYDRGFGREGYQAQVRVRGILKFNGQELFQIEKSNTGLDRSQTIAKCAHQAAQEIVEKVSVFHNVLPDQVYEIKFIGFQDMRDRDNIRKALMELEQQGFMKILEGGEAYGPGKFFHRIKWLRGDSQFAVRSIILEFCRLHQVSIACDKFAPRVMIFTPKGYSGGGDSHSPAPGPGPTPPPNGGDDYVDFDDGPVAPGPPRDENLIEATGQGSRKKYALADAWKNAIMKFLRQNVDADDLAAHKEKIRKHIDENWQRYTEGNWKRLRPYQIIYNWDRDAREITVRVALKEDILLKEITRLTEKVRDKLAGLKVAIVTETKPEVKVGDEWLDRSTMLSTVSNILSNEMTVVDLDAVQKAMKGENLSNEIAAAEDPGSYSFEVWNHANIKILLSLKTVGRKDPVTKHNFWYATISCRMVDIQTGQQFAYFQLESGKESGASPVSAHIRGAREARDQAIKELAKEVARKIVEQCRNRKIILEENVYVLRFIGFDREAREKLEQMVLSLSSGRDRIVTIEEGSVSTGPKLIYRIKWLRSGDSQIHVQNMIKEECELLGLKVDSEKSRQGVIWFEPVGYEGSDE